MSTGDRLQEEKKSNVSYQTDNNHRSSELIESSKVVKRDNSTTVRKDIDHAIDAIIEFNDAPNRPHQQKFYIGIGSVRELCGRGDKAIRNALMSEN